MEERHGFAYVQRTEDEVSMEALPGIATEALNKGEAYTSREWSEKKIRYVEAGDLERGNRESEGSDG